MLENIPSGLIKDAEQLLGELQEADSDKRIAEIIISQLGGTGKLRMMIGATNFVAGHKAVLKQNQNMTGVRVFFTARAKNGIGSFAVFYDRGKDLYNVEYYKKVTIKNSVKFAESPGDMLASMSRGIYVEDLARDIEQTTGLYLSL